MAFARLPQRVERALLAFSTLLLPSSCVVCGAWDTSLCPRCLAAFRGATVRPFRAEGGAESLPDVPLPDVASPDVPSPDLSSPGPGGAVAPQAGPAGPGEEPAPYAGSGPRVPDPRGPGYADPPHAPLPVMTAGSYHGAVPAVLLALKNHGHVDLVPPVAAALAGALHTAVSEFGTGAMPWPGPGAERVVIVPVPTRGSSRRKRGYDPLGLLLGSLRRTGSLPAGTLLLPAVRQIPPARRLGSALAEGDTRTRGRALRQVLLPGLGGGQKGLGRRRRRTQVGFSMQLSRQAGTFLRGAPCIIVDDVLTTGATLGEVHRVLSDHGARVLGAVVIAATASPAGRGAEGPGPARREGRTEPPSMSAR